MVLDSRLMCSCQCNTFNLNLGALWQLLYRHAAPGRLRYKMLLVLRIKLCKVGHIRQEAVDFDNSFNARPRSYKYAPDIGDTRRSKVGNAALDQLSGCGGWYLARDEDERRRVDGLRLLALRT